MRVSCGKVSREGTHELKTSKRLRRSADASIAFFDMRKSRRFQNLQSMSDSVAVSQVNLLSRLISQQLRRFPPANPFSLPST